VKPLGKVTRIMKNGSILLQSSTCPTLYSTAVTKDSKTVGRVRDVFGPASKPYILVNPVRNLGPKDLSALKNSTLYEIPRRKSMRRRKDGRKKG